MFSLKFCAKETPQTPRRKRVYSRVYAASKEAPVGGGDESGGSSASAPVEPAPPATIVVADEEH